MKILLYNWAPIEKQDAGGGVGVYLRNVLNFLHKTGKNHNWDITILSSGFYYTKRGGVYLRREKDYHGFKVLSIVNSPILAPHGTSASMYKKMDNDITVQKIFNDLLEREKYDVVHFHSLEGIPANVLSVKANFPSTKFVHSIHDYGLFCPNVKLWHIDGKNCYRLRCDNCEKCMKSKQFPSHKMIKRLRKDQQSNRSNLLTALEFYGWEYAKKIFSLDSPANKGQIWSAWRSQNIGYINKFVDVELAVSKRVKDIATSYGIDEHKLCVSYIGTKVADEIKEPHQSPTIFSEAFPATILFMGYMTEAKGAYLYLSALESLERATKKKISLKFASRINDSELLNRINNLESDFASITIYNGYSHEDFETIMNGVDLGIVPPIWEDNLPQVTLEIIANGIPALTSECGGAQELNDCPAFKFKDKEDLTNKIKSIVNNPILLREYWHYSKPLTTMAEHIKHLESIYIE